VVRNDVKNWKSFEPASWKWSRKLSILVCNLTSLFISKGIKKKILSCAFWSLVREEIRKLEAVVSYWKWKWYQLHLPLPSCLALIYAQITCLKV